MINKKALVVLSGGMDSITCLGYALAVYKQVEAITFAYGQRHACEIEAAFQVCAHRDVKLKIAETNILQTLVTSALTTKDMPISVTHSRERTLPASFVPVRNAFFLTLAHGYAQEIGAGVIITGVCQTDYSGYPDCRENFIKALESALNIGYEKEIQIETPLMFKTKAETFAFAEEFGILSDVLNISQTCYEGDREVLHEWGYGCGECPACKLRAKGWEEYKAEKYKAQKV